MNGFGMLVITKLNGPVVQQWALQEGGWVVAELAGHEYRFVLQKASLPSEFDVRRMDSAQLVKALVNKLEDEAREREERDEQEYYGE